MGSKSSKSESNSTSNYYDQRQVQDAGGGIAGNGNQWDQSVTSIDASTTTWDASNRSTNNWTDSSSTTWDASNRSTNNWTDSSTTTVNYVDGGQTAAARDIATAAIQAARDSSMTASRAAIDAQNAAIGSTDKTTRAAFDFASSNSAQLAKSSSDALGWAGQQFGIVAGLTGDILKASKANADSASASVAGAYSSAAAQANGNKTLTIAALAAVALVAAVVVMNKGK